MINFTEFPPSIKKIDMNIHPQPSNACLKSHEDTYYMQVRVDEASAIENDDTVDTNLLYKTKKINQKE